jgi:CHAT domain-containing protein
VKLLELERSLRQQINDKAGARATLLSNKQTQPQAAFFEKEIAELTSRHRQVEVQIRQSSPRYAALTQPQPLSADEIKQQLDDNTVLLEFALGEKRSWLWAVTRSSIDSYQLASGNEIESIARRVYESLTARQPRKGETDDQYEARIKNAETTFQTESATLSLMLLGQIAARLQQDWKGKRLAIVATGALQYIPFAALPISKAADQVKGANPQSVEPLITQHEIVNLPSASVLATIRSETAGRKGAQKTLAIIADPVFEANDLRVINALKNATNPRISAGVRSGGDDSSSPGSNGPAGIDLTLVRSLRSFNLINERGGFHRLPFSREEADAFVSLTSADSLLKATDFRANRKIATSGELSHYRIVHFATHGLLNSEQPELSGLVLSLVDETGKAQDGFLRMQEIYNLQMPADLIVLSACQTALGKEIRGEGLVGLTRGFMYAGAQRVVASLWQVDDLATAELMKRFYRGMLKDGMRPAQALRLAQLEMFKQRRWSSPFFWAPFFIQGEWR